VTAKCQDKTGIIGDWRFILGCFLILCHIEERRKPNRLGNYCHNGTTTSLTSVEPRTGLAERNSTRQSLRRARGYKKRSRKHPSTIFRTYGAGEMTKPRKGKSFLDTLARLWRGFHPSGTPYGGPAYKGGISTGQADHTDRKTERV
jgi:hypothetical protein